SLRECSRVLIEDCTFQNSPCWNLHPLYCQDVVIRGITVRNPHYSANGDGIDIDACENVILTESSFDVGDDAICIKSGKDADGRRHARKCRNLIISDCTVYHGHGGFVVGSEMSGGVENIRVTRCRFIGTDVGLRFKSTRGRGGLVKDIWCDHIYMKDIVTYGVIFNLYYAGVAATDMDPDAKSDLQPVDETTPEFRDIHVSDVLCAGADQAVFINGLPELPVRNIDFHNSNFTAKKGEEVHFAENITFDNVTINGKRL
ncbi:MAG: right-handed parallel beta-helix repeat-containing protein, partial [Bacteroidales bacterium]|nr:right-handed parallel beta-helix repeat-containing protein [Bacteroidales bacterium]